MDEKKYVILPPRGDQDGWVNIPEAGSRARVDPDSGPTTIAVTEDGAMHYDANQGVHIERTK